MIESEEFYNIAQRYRHSDIAKPEEVLTAYQEMLAYIDTQIAAAVSSAMVWQPIADIPHDGVEVLLRGVNGYYYVNSWKTIASYHTNENLQEYMARRFTHFMLIKPPEGL